MAQKKKQPRRIDTTFFGARSDEPEIVELGLDDLKPNPDQPRQNFDPEALRELADSIERHGLIQPISVMDMPDLGYVIVAGERRYRAHKLLDRPTIQAIVIQNGAIDELALIENVQRQDLTPLEEAEGYLRLMERHGYSQGDVAKVVGKGRTVINRVMRLNSLPEAIKSEVRDTPSVSKSILLEISRAESEREQLDLWKRHQTGELTVQKARKAKGPATQGSQGVRRRTPVVKGALSSAKKLKKQLQTIDIEDFVVEEGSFQELSIVLRQIRELSLELATKVSAKG